MDAINRLSDTINCLTHEEAEKRASKFLHLFRDRLSEAEYTARIKQLIPSIHPINKLTIPRATFAKLNQVIQREYQHYIYFCDLLKTKKINIIHTSYDSNFKKTRIYGALDKSQPECDIYKDHVVIHPPMIRHSSLMIPRRYFKSDQIECGLMSSYTDLLYYIANSWTNTALCYIDEGNYINDYSMESGHTPLLLALCNGWNHADPRKYSLMQKPIIEALLAKKALDINCIHLKNGMTPLHIACLRGDDPKLIQSLLARGADCNALDYQGRKPVDLLNISDEEMQNIISELNASSDCVFSAAERSQSLFDKLERATVPSSKERKRSIIEIRYLLAKYAVRQIIPEFA